MAANRNELQKALQQPYDRILFGKEVLSPVFGSCFNLSSTAVPASVQLNQTEQKVIQSVSIYGTIKLEDGTDVTCYEIILQPWVRIEHSKVAIQRYVRKLLTAGQMALVNFIAPQNNKVWRLTLIAKDSELTEQGIKEKTTHAKRYTYLLGPSETCKTAAERFELLSTEKEITFQTLVKAFSVEKLSKAFIDEYTEHYKKFCNYLQESNFRKSVFKISFPENATNEEKEKACKPIRDFVKKLLGRIVFLYFVQKKGWLGASDTQYKDGFTDFIKQLFKQSGGNDAFYSTWLTKLFFETLNKERSNDDFKMPNGKKVKVPFLNGGLFDKEKYDEATLTIPATFFYHPDWEEIPLTGENRNHARGFLDFLDAFNFTVHEDSPDDHTVAVDPEMLGQIFENLLEDNKDKGAFYTPKEIVHYMCQESLTEYLTTHLSKEYTVYKEIGNAQVELFGNETKIGQLKMMEQLGDKALNRDDVAYIVKHKDISRLTQAQLKKIDALLDTVKICDPAIGSGAFPMGLLQEIHAIKEVIAYELQLPWKPAEVKENIIQNSIYGVDIEKGAVDIARLRFWLSLVVDEEKPRALPNLDYKIVVGDSLVSKFEGEIIDIDWEIKEGTQAHIFGNENLLKRQELLKKITAKQQEYFHANVFNKQKLAEEIRNLKIDILINQLELMINTKGLEKKPSETGKKAAAQMELWLQTQGWKNTIAKLQKLKQNKEAPFEHFDWKLDFPEVLNPYLVTDEKMRGFDIVIGNPPYGANIDDLIKYFEVNFPKTTKGFKDIYKIFYNQGLEKLTKKKGVLTYITPNTFLLQPRYKDLRQFFLEYKIISILNLGENVFEEVTVPTAIIVIKNDKNYDKLRFADISKDSKYTGKISSIQFIEVNQSIYYKTQSNIFTDSIRLKAENEEQLVNILIFKDAGINYQRVNVGLSDKGNSDLSKRLLYEGKKEKESHIEYWKGTDMNSFYIAPTTNRFVRPNIRLRENERVILNSEFFRITPKLIWRQTAPTIIAAIDRIGIWFGRSIQAGIIRPEYSDSISYEYLCCLLNSKYIRNIYEKSVQEGGRVFPQVKLEKLKSLPIKLISMEAQKPFIEICKKIEKVKSKKENSDIIEFENDINIRIYKLYELTYDEVKVIDPEFTLSKEEYDKIQLE
jgi:hypothetical protein